MNLDIPIGLTPGNYMKTVYETSSTLDGRTIKIARHQTEINLFDCVMSKTYPTLVFLSNMKQY